MCLYVLLHFCNMIFVFVCVCVVGWPLYLCNRVHFAIVCFPQRDCPTINLPSPYCLQVVHSRRDSDSGVYWCEAHNQLGTVRSHNATLQVAGK